MLNKNTVDICFIHVQNNHQKPELWFKHPLSKPYPFYVSPQIRKEIDIGSVIEHHNPDYEKQANQPYCFGVIVNNYTKAHADEKFKPVTEVKHPGHLRTFLENHFAFKRNQAESNRLYNSFRHNSHHYWIQKYIDADKKKH